VSVLCSIGIYFGHGASYRQFLLLQRYAVQPVWLDLVNCNTSDAFHTAQNAPKLVFCQGPVFHRMRLGCETVGNTCHL